MTRRRDEDADAADSGYLPLRILLVEDDAGDALLIRELLRAQPSPTDMRVVGTVADAVAALRGAAPDCVLLDLGLPDAVGLDAVDEVRRVAPRIPVVVLTGLADDRAGRLAVAAGAQDYLVKDAVTGDSLGRSVRYAIERQAAAESLRRLAETELLAAENRRTERGLLPTPSVTDRHVRWQTAYRAGRQRALLGGDFLDVVERDGKIHVVIGDVAGHGPDEAALGVSLRVAFRALVLAGVAPDDVLPVMSGVLDGEKPAVDWRHVFATACYVIVEPNRTTLQVRLAGHPPPFVFAPEACQLSDLPVGPPLGALPDVSWPGTAVEVPDLRGLLLVTDGLLEGLEIPGGPDRLGEDGLLAILRTQGSQDCDLAAVIVAVVERNGGPLSDDVAAVLLQFGAEGS